MTTRGFVPVGTVLRSALVRFWRAAVGRLSEIERDLTEGTYRRAYLRARIREANEIVRRLVDVQTGTASGEVQGWAREAFPRTYESGAGMAVRDLGAQGVQAIAGDPRIHTRAVEAVFDRYLAPTIDAAVQLHANVIRSGRVAMESAGFAQEIAEGIIGGQTRREVSRALQRRLRQAAAASGAEGIDLTHVEVGGRTWRADYWAELHARTELARASTAGTRVLSAVNGVGHVMLTTHAHPPCICTPFEGRIYAIERGDPRFPWIGEVPGGGVPLHPNCVHREAPAVVAFLEDRGELEGRDSIPPAFRGLDERELGRVVRANAGQLRRFSESREGFLPAGFRPRQVA